MAPEEKIIEFQTVKKGRTIIFIALIAVFALASIGFLLLWVLKSPGINAGVTNIQMQGNLLQASTDNEGNVVYVASANAEYTVYADVSVFGDVAPAIEWIPSPSQYFIVDPSKNGIDPNNPNRYFYTFTIAHDAPDGVAAQIMARSKTSGEVTAQYSFTIKAQYTDEFSIKGISGNESKQHDFQKTADNMYSVTLPYFASSIPKAETLNTSYVFFTQLGALGLNGERAKLTKGIPGTNPNYVVNAIEYELVDMSAAGVAEFDSTAGSRGIEPGSVQNKDDMTSLRLLGTGTFRLKATANKYNSSDEMILYLDVTVKNITAYDNVLSSISINETINLYIDEMTPLDLADPGKNLISFSRPAPAGTSWSYRIYESTQDGTEINSAGAKLIINGTKLSPSSKPGRTYITIKDTSANGFGASDTKPVNIYAPIKNLSVSYKNADLDKTEIQRLDKLNFTASFNNIFNPEGLALPGGIGLNYTLEFAYANKAQEPVYESGRFINAADTVTFDAMEYVRTEGNVRVYAINISLNTAYNIVISSDNKSATLRFDAKVGSNAKLEEYSILFFTQPQSGNGTNVISTVNPVKFTVRDVVTRMEFKTGSDDKPTLDKDRFFVADTGSQSKRYKQYLIKMISNDNSSYSLMDLVKFYNGSTFVTNTGALPNGVTVSPKTVFVGGESTSTYKFVSRAYETSEIEITITVKSGQTSENYYLYLKYENIPANLEMTASDTGSGGARVINYNKSAKIIDTESGAATSSDIGLGKDTLTTRYASNSTEGNAALYTYIFASNKDNSKIKMLTHKAESANTGVYLSAAGATKLFTISGNKTVNLDTDLFALSMINIKDAGSEWGKLDNFIVVYSLIPLKPSADGTPEVNTPYQGRYYDDYIYGAEKTNRLIQFRYYKAYRAFDDAAFYTNNTYTTPLSRYTGNPGAGDTAADFYRNINAPTPFTLYPSGILKYKDNTGSDIELTYEKEIKDSSSPLKTTLNIVALGAIKGPARVESISGSEPNTYYVQTAGQDEQFEMTLAVNQIKSAATKSLKLLYQNDELKVKGFEFYSDSALTALIPTGRTLSLKNGVADDIEFIYIKVIYNAYLPGTHVNYEEVMPYLNGAKINKLNQSGNLVKLELIIPTGGIIPGDSIVESSIGNFAAPELVLQIKITSNNINGNQPFKFNNSNHSIAVFPVLNIDVTTAVAGFDVCHGGNDTGSGYTDILMTAKKENDIISLKEAVTEEFTLEYKNEAGVTGADPDTNPLHLDWNNAVISIYDNTAGANITNNSTISVSLISPGTLTVTTKGHCYDDLTITVNINYKTFKNFINADATNMNSVARYKSFNIRVVSEIFAIEFTDASDPDTILEGITVRPTGGTGGNYEYTMFGVEYNGGIAELSGLISGAAAKFSVESVGDSNDYATRYFAPNSNFTGRRLQISVGAPEVPANVELWLIASWTSQLGTTPVTVTHKIPITVLTRDVSVTLNTDYNEVYTSGGINTTKTTIDYYSTDLMDLSLSLKNLWTNAVETDTSRYTRSYSITGQPAWIRLDSTDNSKIENIGIGAEATQTASFIVTATVNIKNKDLTSNDVTRTLIITVRLFYRADAIEATKKLPGQTNEPATHADAIELTLVKGYSLDLTKYFRLINTALEAANQTDVWSQNFSVSIESGGETYLSQTDKIINVKKAGGSNVAVTLTADKNANDTEVPAATRVLYITTYTPTFEPVADVSGFNSDIIKLKTESVADENVYVYNLFPATKYIPVKFSLGGVAAANTEITAVSVTFTDFETLFSGTLSFSGGVYSAQYSINSVNLTANHITGVSNTQIFNAYLSFKADGILIEKTLRFILRAELSASQAEAMTVEINANNTPVSDGGEIKIGIGSVSIKANIKDEFGLIAGMVAKYGAAVVYKLTVLDDAGNPLATSTAAEIDGSTGEITIKSRTAAFRVKAELNLKGIIFSSQTLLAPTLPETSNPGWPKAVVTDVSKLVTKLYVGKDYADAVGKGMVNNAANIDVSFDDPATNQKYLFVVIDYKDANYQYDTDTVGAFKPVVSGSGINGNVAEKVHIYNDPNLRIFYAKYLITGVGGIKAYGLITSKGIEYSSPEATVSFIAAEPFAANIYASSTIPLSVKGTKTAALTPVVAADFKGNISYTYTLTGSYSNFMTFNAAGASTGNFGFTLKNYNTIADLSKFIDDDIKLTVTAKVTSGVYKNMEVSQIVTIDVTPVDAPVFQDPDGTDLGIKTASTANVEINDSALVYIRAKNTAINVFTPSAMSTAAGLFKVIPNGTDTGFAFGTPSIKVYNGVTLLSTLSNDGSGNYKYTTPDYSANLTIVAELTVSGGSYAGVKYTVKMHIHVLPTIKLTSGGAVEVDTQSGVTVALKIEADKYVNSSGNLMNVAFVNISDTSLGAFSTPVAVNNSDPQIYTAYFNAAKGTLGGELTFKVDAIIGGGNVFSGQTFTSNELKINVRSVDLTADDTHWDTDFDSGWQIDTSGARPKIIMSAGSSTDAAVLTADALEDYITLGDFGPISGAVSVGIKLVSNPSYGTRINNTVTNEITVPKGANFGVATTYEDALEVTVISGSVTYINYFTIEILPDAAPSVTLAPAKYYDVAQAAFITMPAGTDIYVGDTVELSFTSAYGYGLSALSAVTKISGSTVSGYGNIASDPSGKKLIFTATKATAAGDTLSLTGFNAITEYGNSVAVSGAVSFKILEHGTTALTMTPSVTQLFTDGILTAPITNKSGSAKFEHSEYRIDITYANILFASVALVDDNGAGTALTNSAVSVSGEYTTLTFTRKNANPNGLVLKLTAKASINSDIEILTAVSIKVRYDVSGVIKSELMSLSVGMLDYTRNKPVLETSKTGLFYNDEKQLSDSAALSVKAEVLKEKSIIYRITSGNEASFENTVSDVITGNTLKLKPEVAAISSAPIVVTVKADITAAGKPKTEIENSVTVTFYPVLKITSINKLTEGVYEVITNSAVLGLTGATFNYTVNADSPHAFTKSGAIFTYVRPNPGPQGFPANFSAIVTNQGAGNAIYKDTMATLSIDVKIAKADDPTVNSGVYRHPLDNAGYIIAPSVTLPNGLGTGEIAAGSVVYALAEGLNGATGAAGSAADKGLITLNANGTFSRIPTADGGSQWVKVTVTLSNDDDINKIYKNISYSTYVEVVVDNVVISFTATVASRLDFTLAAAFTGIYSSLTPAPAVTFAIQGGTSKYAYFKDAVTLTKMPTYDGGPVTLTATINHNGTNFTATRTVEVESANIRFTATSSLDSDMTLNAEFIGIYESYTSTATKSYSIPVAADSGAEFADVYSAAAKLTKKPTANGGKTKLLATLVHVNGIGGNETFTQPLTVDVEKAEVLLTVSQNAGGATAALDVEFMGIYSSYTQHSTKSFAVDKSKLATIENGNTLKKQPDKDGGSVIVTATLEYSYTVGTGDSATTVSASFEKTQSVNVERANIEFTATPQSLEGGVTSKTRLTLNAALTGIYSDTDDYPVDGVVFASANEALAKIDTDGITLIKQPHGTGGNVTITAALTYKYTVGTGESAQEKSVTYPAVSRVIYVEPASITTSAAAIDNGRTGTLETAFGGVYIGTPDPDTQDITYSLSGDTADVNSSNILELTFDEDTNVCTYTKKPMPGGGVQRVYIEYNGFTTHVDITVEPLGASLSHTPSGETGTLTVRVNDIYSEVLASGAGAEITLPEDKNLIKLTLDDNNALVATYAKKLSATGGTQAVQATLVLGDGTDYVLTAYVSVPAAVISRDVEFNPDSISGTITPSLTNGTYTSVDVTVDEDSAGLLTITPNGDGTFGFEMIRTPSGGIAYYTVTYVNDDVSSLSSPAQAFSIDVPGVMQLAVNHGYDGTITLTPTLFGAVESITYSLVDGAENEGVYQNNLIDFTPYGAGSYGGTYRKKLTNGDGTATIYITVTIDSIEYFYTVEVPVERAVVSAITDDNGITGTVTPSVKNTKGEDIIYDSVTVIRKADGKTDKLIDIDVDAISGVTTYTKKPTMSGGWATLVVTYMFDSVSVQGEFRIFVEPFSDIIEAVDDEGNNTGNVVISVNSVFLPATPAFATTNTNLISLDTATGAYTKKLSEVDAMAKITVTFAEYPGFTQQVYVEITAAVIESSLSSAGRTGNVNSSINKSNAIVSNITVNAGSETLLKITGNGFKKLPSVNGGTAYYTVTYSNGVSSLSKTFSVAVEGGINAVLSVSGATRYLNISLKAGTIFSSFALSNITYTEYSDTNNNMTISGSGAQCTITRTTGSTIIIGVIKVTMTHDGETITIYFNVSF